MGEKCVKCGSFNHFASKCRKSNKVNKMNEIGCSETENGSDSEISDVESLSTLNAVSHKNAIYAKLHIANKPVKIQIDCGATVNILPISMAGNAPIKPTSTLLNMWNRTIVKPIGEAKMHVYNPITTEQFNCKFIIVPDNKGLVPLLGSKASQKMRLLTVNTQNFKQLAAVTHC